MSLCENIKLVSELISYDMSDGHTWIMLHWYTVDLFNMSAIHHGSATKVCNGLMEIWGRYLGTEIMKTADIACHLLAVLCTVLWTSDFCSIVCNENSADFAVVCIVCIQCTYWLCLCLSVQSGHVMCHLTCACFGQICWQFVLEQSDSRLESIRRFVLGESISFVKKSAIRFGRCIRLINDDTPWHSPILHCCIYHSAVQISSLCSFLV